MFLLQTTDNRQLGLMLKSFKLCVTIYFFETKGCNLLGTLNATLYVLSFPGMQTELAYLFGNIFCLPSFWLINLALSKRFVSR